MPDNLEIRTDQAEIRDRSSSRVARAIGFVREHGIGEIWKLARATGWSGTAHFVHRNVRYLLATRYDRAFDARHAIDTSGDVPAAFLETDSPNAALGNQFVSTSARSFNAITKMLPADVTEFSFVDIGSGKGRTLILAGSLPFRDVLGIEYAPSLVEIANRNVQTYRGPPKRRAESVRSICADATAVGYPMTPLVIYLFNPFATEIFEKVFARILDSYRAAPRPVLIVYASGVEDVLERVSGIVLDSPEFTLRRDVALPFFLDAPWRLLCRIYATKEVR